MPPKKKQTPSTSTLSAIRGTSYANENGVWLERCIIKATWSLPTKRLSLELNDYFQERIGNLGAVLANKLEITLGKRRRELMDLGSSAIGLSDEEDGAISPPSKTPLTKGQTTLNFGRATSRSCLEDSRLLTPSDLQKECLDLTSSPSRSYIGATPEPASPGEFES